MSKVFARERSRRKRSCGCPAETAASTSTYSTSTYSTAAFSTVIAEGSFGASSAAASCRRYIH